MSTPIRGPLRVLVVDDFRRLADYVVQLLTESGYHACAAYDGEHALRTAESFLPDAVISDIYMPRMNGFQLAAAISGRFPECMVLLTSANSELSSSSQKPQQFRIVPKSSLLDELNDFLESCYPASAAKIPA